MQRGERQISPLKCTKTKARDCTPQLSPPHDAHGNLQGTARKNPYMTFGETPNHKNTANLINMAFNYNPIHDNSKQVTIDGYSHIENQQYMRGNEYNKDESRRQLFTCDKLIDEDEDQEFEDENDDDCHHKVSSFVDSILDDEI